MALVLKNVPAHAGDIRDAGLIPGWGRSPGEGNGNPLQYSCLENPMDRGPDRLQFIELQRVRHDWSSLAHTDAGQNEVLRWGCAIGLASLQKQIRIRTLVRWGRKWSVSRSVMSDSLRAHGLQPARLLCPRDSPGKNTGVGCHALLQGHLPDPGLELGSPAPGKSRQKVAIGEPRREVSGEAALLPCPRIPSLRNCGNMRACGFSLGCGTPGSWGAAEAKPLTWRRCSCQNSHSLQVGGDPGSRRSSPFTWQTEAGEGSWPTPAGLARPLQNLLPPPRPALRRRGGWECGLRGGCPGLEPTPGPLTPKATLEERPWSLGLQFPPLRRQGNNDNCLTWAPRGVDGMKHMLGGYKQAWHTVFSEVMPARRCSYFTAGEGDKLDSVGCSVMSNSLQPHGL